MPYVLGRLVWDVYDRWVGIEAVRHENPEMHLLGFHILELSVIANKVWKEIWVAIVSELWSQRNKIIFNNGVVDSKEIFCLTQLKCWSWLKHIEPNFYVSYPELCLCPLKCIKIGGRW